jgi:hypothetical protein
MKRLGKLLRIDRDQRGYEKMTLESEAGLL